MMTIVIVAANSHCEVTVLKTEVPDTLVLVLGVWCDLRQPFCFPLSIFSSLDKDQIKVVIDKVTQWLYLAEEGDQMTLPGIAGRQEAIAPHLGAQGCLGNASDGGEHVLFPISSDRRCLMTESETFANILGLKS